MNLRVHLQTEPSINMFKIYSGHVDIEVHDMRDAFFSAVDYLKQAGFPELEYADWKLKGIEILDEGGM